MKSNKKPQALGVELARQQLPTIVAAAAAGQTTVITKHGQEVAAVVPIMLLAANVKKPQSLLALAGSGKGMWGSDSAKKIRHLRDEWNR